MKNGKEVGGKKQKQLQTFPSKKGEMFGEDVFVIFQEPVFSHEKDKTFLPVFFQPNERKGCFDQ